MQTLKFKCSFRYRQSNVRRLLPTFDYCRARSNQIAVYSSDNETVLGSGRNLGGLAEQLIDGSEKNICRSTFLFYTPHVIEKRNRKIELIVSLHAAFSGSLPIFFYFLFFFGGGGLGCFCRLHCTCLPI